MREIIYYGAGANLRDFEEDFVRETGTQTEKILDYYFGKSDVFPVTEYTAGHYKRGVE